jgi:hypothetical protein
MWQREEHVKETCSIPHAFSMMTKSDLEGATGNVRKRAESYWKKKQNG